MWIITVTFYVLVGNNTHALNRINTPSTGAMISPYLVDNDANEVGILVGKKEHTPSLESWQ
jgi:hypothetical protein